MGNIQRAEKEKLLASANKSISIGVIEAGKIPKNIPIPWVGEVQSLAMRTPDVYLSAKDLKNEEVLKLIRKARVIGLYILAPLIDYSFISDFKYLEQVYIENANSLNNVDFLKGLAFCKMLYLQNAKLENLNTIIELKKQQKENFKYLSAIALDNCNVKDLSLFEKEDVIFLEFLIYSPKTKGDKKRWQVVSAARKRYCAYDV